MRDVHVERAGRAELELVARSHFTRVLETRVTALEDVRKVGAQLLLREERLFDSVDHEVAPAVERALKAGSSRSTGEITEPGAEHDGQAADDDVAEDAACQQSRRRRCLIDLVVHEVDGHARGVCEPTEACLVWVDRPFEAIRGPDARRAYGHVGEEQMVRDRLARVTRRHVRVFGDYVRKKVRDEMIIRLDLVPHRAMFGNVVGHQPPDERFLRVLRRHARFFFSLEEEEEQECARGAQIWEGEVREGAKRRRSPEVLRLLRDNVHEQ